jgi:hypothetical protein
VNIQALSDEAILLAQIRDAGLPEPSWRGTSESGDVCLTWSRGGKIVASIGLEGDGMYGAALRRDGAFKAISADGDLSKPLSEDLATYLRELES